MADQIEAGVRLEVPVGPVTIARISRRNRLATGVELLDFRDTALSRLRPWVVAHKGPALRLGPFIRGAHFTAMTATDGGREPSPPVSC